MFAKSMVSLGLGIFLLGLCAMNMEAKTTVSKASFGKTSDGTPVEIYTLSNDAIEARIMTYGGTIVSLKTPDRNGKSGDIVLGFDSIEAYQAKSPFFGAIIGRYGNRIAKGRFTLNGKTYSLPTNDGPNTLHGGKGFDKVVWKAKEIEGGIELSYLSKDGDQGFPGNLTTTVRYTLAGNDLKIDYSATTDKDTVVNLTNHSYFNLAGQGSGDILKQVMQINASYYTPVDGTLIPTGDVAPVAGTPFDFLKPHVIGERINADNQQLKLGIGYDHNFVLDNKTGKIALAAKAYDPSSGRTLEVLTDEPSIQFYSGNHLEGPLAGKDGKTYNFRDGFCLETQHYPDSPNHPKFPSTELKAGQHYHTVTIFRFGSQK